MASHAESKAERRARIIRAARALIRETGRTGLSMRALASRAGVSLATPYNLLGSKEAVLKALLEADLQEFREALPIPGSGDPIEHIFAAITVATRLYSTEESFYRALFLALFESDNVELRTFYGPDRQQFWAGLLREAVCTGQVLAGTDVAALARNIRYVFAGVLHRWATSSSRPGWIEAEIGYGVSLALCAVATPGAIGRIRARLNAYQERIAEHQTAEPAIPPESTASCRTASV
ncbi:TetR/AcrR family transcriptional regulator [Siccirubricoccus phaeus]|uniref:TetR/AcrR family transcriptional regulator n=1 Tax=Siccirubricoccus phaeus TaxID=2595053 RepID=UPI0011F1FDBF|nr:TetR/AcrR family transcriptional regulator [Siccirubricoccus phaeus]